jgi:hypothetical protein
MAANPPLERKPDPLLVALEAAYRARQDADAARVPRPSDRDRLAHMAYTEALRRLWLACDAAWGPTQTHIEPCSVCGKVAHENWCSELADY